MRIVAGAWPAVLDPTAEQAHVLSTLLGDNHDLQLLADDVAASPSLRDQRRLETAIAERQEQLLEEAFALGGRFYAERPKAFRARLDVYLAALA